MGVLGLGDPLVYTGPLARLGLACETLEPAKRARLDRAIFRLMEGEDGAEGAAVAREAVATLRARGVDGIVLGCTEIPLLLGGVVEEPDLLDPAELLAEAAIRHAAG